MEEASQARKAGIAKCILKPFKQSELLAAILFALDKIKQTQREQKTTTHLDTENAGPPLRILLAEDNRVNQLLAVRMLEKRGHRVVAVQNGAEAIDAMESGRFDLALLDVQMPVMDGLEVARLTRLRECETGASRIPLIALTAYAMSGDRERCLAAGMDGYVPKPIKLQELLEVISKLRPSHTGAAKEMQNPETRVSSLRG